MRLPTSLRVALLAAILTLAANFAVVGFIRWRTHDESAGEIHRQVVEEGAVLDAVYASGDKAALEQAVANVIAARDPQYFAGILAPDGRPLSGKVAALVHPPPTGYHTGLLRRTAGGPPIEAAFTLRKLANGDWLLSGRSFAQRLAFQRTLERSLLLALAISLLLGLGSGWVIARYVGRRVRDISQVADRIGNGEMTHRVPLSGSGDAFDGLAAQINRMLDRIGALMQELRLLTDCLAHDLRSPLGRLRARIDAAMEASEERRDALFAGVLHEADSLMRILTTVLEIGRAEAMAPRNQFAWLDPGELVSELAEMYEPNAEEAGVSLVLDKGPVVLPLFGHRQLLAQAISNLLDNALNYAANGGELRLFAMAQDGMLRLGVADRGPGIAPGDRAEARRQFGRLDVARTPGGAGLGLALVEAVAHLHRGQLELEDNEPGLVACLILPIRPRD
jgi:signal transduction histidine kinase